MRRDSTSGTTCLRVGAVAAVILCSMLIPGCTVHYPVVGARDVADGELNLDLFSEAMRMMESERRSGAGAVREDSTGEDWAVHAVLHLGGTHTVPPSRTTEYVVLVTDEFRGRRNVTVMIVAPDAEPITRRTSFQSTAIIGENRCLLEAGEYAVYGDERSPVVAVTFFHSNSAILVGWVQDDDVHEFTVEISNGRTLTLAASDYEYFIGVVERRSTRRPSWILPVVTGVAAVDDDGEAIR